MSLGQAHLDKSTLPGLIHVQGVWTGGGAASAMTHTSTDWSRGIVSIAYNSATGKYLITFTDVGQQIVGDSCKVWTASGDKPWTAVVIRSSLSTTAKTVEVEIWDQDGDALSDLGTSQKLAVDITFAPAAP